MTNHLFGSSTVQGMREEELSTQAIGCLMLRDSRGREILLSNVLYMSGLQSSIVSISRLSEVGLSCTFDHKRFLVSDQGSNIRFESILDGVFCFATAIKLHQQGCMAAALTNSPPVVNRAKCFAASLQR